MAVIWLLWGLIRALFTTQATLAAENLVLRQQVIVLRRSVKRPRVRNMAKPTFNSSPRQASSRTTTSPNRHCALWSSIATQGTRTATGQRWCDRIWTVLTTCAQQCRNAMKLLIDATTAWVQGHRPPSLLPESVPG